MSTFDHIRPYHDDEVEAVLNRLARNPELLDTLIRFRFPHLPAFLRAPLRWPLSKKLLSTVSDVHSVTDFQLMVAKYMHQMITTTTKQVTYTGIEHLDLSKPCLFISNHRDIALDPAFVNWGLHVRGNNTVRIAIGDNLLTKDWVSDLMRLNKSFIVRRSAESKREKLNVSKELSAYIHYSLAEEGSHIWIAQKEGRAKDGIDRTNAALISMLMLNRPKEMDFDDYVHELRIVPVAISYEFDPCDEAKAKELWQQEETGKYEKEDHEDVQSISRGITGDKGRVHIHFCQPLDGQYGSARAVAAAVDREILGHYQLMPSNILAAQQLGLGVDEWLHLVSDEDRQSFEKRLEAVPEPIKCRMLAMYAAPVESRQKLDALTDSALAE